jgi:hypothetical protein
MQTHHEEVRMCVENVEVRLTAGQTAPSGSSGMHAQTREMEFEAAGVLQLMSSCSNMHAQVEKVCAPGEVKESELQLLPTARQGRQT